MYKEETTQVMRLLALLGCIACLLMSSTVSASVLKNNSRSAIDVSVKTHSVGSSNWTQGAFGLDLHQVFSGPRGDVGTLTLQPYLLRIDDSPNVQGLFDDQHDWALQWRIANFNYTGLGHGRFNVRVGHFELPFGLEQVVQTNGTLYQVQTPTGLKADWGMSVNGQTRHLNYEFAYMTGSGNDLDVDHSGLAVGRIGTPNNRFAWVGLSYMKGELQAPIEPLDRQRWGVDAGVELPVGFSVLGEFVRARESNRPSDHLYAELRWRNPSERLHLFSQWRQARVGLTTGSNEEQTIALGVRYEPNRLWSMSAIAKHQLRGVASPNQFVLQLRYRFQNVL